MYLWINKALSGFLTMLNNSLDTSSLSTILTDLNMDSVKAEVKNDGINYQEKDKDDIKPTTQMQSTTSALNKANETKKRVRLNIVKCIGYCICNKCNKFFFLFNKGY